MKTITIVKRKLEPVRSWWFYYLRLDFVNIILTAILFFLLLLSRHSPCSRHPTMPRGTCNKKRNNRSHSVYEVAAACHTCYEHTHLLSMSQHQPSPSSSEESNRSRRNQPPELPPIPKIDRNTNTSRASRIHARRSATRVLLPVTSCVDLQSAGTAAGGSSSAPISAVARCARTDSLIRVSFLLHRMVQTFTVAT